MKILSIARTQNYLPNNNPGQRYHIQSPNTDTFERTTNVNFKATPVNHLQKAAQEVMNDPRLAQKLAAFLTAGFIALKGLADSDKDVENNAKEQVEEFLTRNITQEETETDEEQIIEPEKTDEELNNESSTAEKELPAENTQETKHRFTEFPKKRGRLTANLENLKYTTSNLNLNDEYTCKLIVICQELMNKNSHTIDNKVYENNEIAYLLNNDLLNEDNAPETVIDKYHEIISPKPSQAELVGSSSSNIGLKIVGKIDLPKKTLTDEECIQRSSFETDQINESFIFKLPTNYGYSAKETLRMMLLQFEKTISDNGEKHIFWHHGKTVAANTYETDVVAEIKKHNKKQYDINGNLFSEPYVRVKESDAQVITEIINSEPRFSEYFSLHGAVRFFERYIDFDSDDIEQQCKEKLDALEKLIQLASTKNGITIEEYTYKNNKGNDIVGLAAKIDPRDYGKEIVQKLGSYPIRIAVCENQPIQAYYNKKNKQPLICTIYSKGV